MKIQEELCIIKSKLGWRKQKGNGNHDTPTNNILPEIHQFTTIEPSLQPKPDIELEFWKLETIGTIPPEKTKNNDGLMEHFNNTVI